MSASLFGTGGTVNVNAAGSLITQSFVGTAAQTLFTLTNFTYTPGSNSLLVFINGQKQWVSRDYIETSGSSFTLTQGVIVGDNVDVIGFPQTTLVANTAGLTTYTPPGTGGVQRTVQSSLQEYISVTDYGAVMNSPASTAVNSAALLAAAAVNNNVYIPPGVFWMASNTDWSAFGNLQLFGAGAGVTFIQGANDLFKLTNQATFGTPSFKDFTIQNSGGNGKLFTVATGTPYNRIKYERIEFLASNYHIFSSDLAVSQYFLGCRFNGALICSRFYAGLWVMCEVGSYVWFNTTGLQVSGNSASSNDSYGSVYELNTGSGVSLVANGNDILGFNFYGGHFEQNGSTAGAADVVLQTTSANQIRGIKFYATGFFTPTGLQTVRIQTNAGGGGNIANCGVHGGYVGGAIPICTSDIAFTIGDDVTFQSGGIPAACSTTFKALSGSGTFDPPSLTTGSGSTTTLAVAGAALGDLVVVSFSLDLQGIGLTAYVSAAGTVSIRFQNQTGGTLDLASGTLRVRVIRQA